MITVQERERIRRASFLEEKSIRQICDELHHSTETVRSALRQAEARQAQGRERESPVLGPYQARIEALLLENAQLPRKQRDTSHRIYELVCEEGYPGGHFAAM